MALPLELEGVPVKTARSAARDALAPLRRHPDLRVRHAALQVFTRREAPAAGIDDEDPDSYFDD